MWSLLWGDPAPSLEHTSPLALPSPPLSMRKQPAPSLVQGPENIVFLHKETGKRKPSSMSGISRVSPSSFWQSMKAPKVSLLFLESLVKQDSSYSGKSWEVHVPFAWPKQGPDWDGLARVSLEEAYHRIILLCQRHKLPEPLGWNVWANERMNPVAQIQ